MEKENKPLSEKRNNKPAGGYGAFYYEEDIEATNKRVMERLKENIPNFVDESYPKGLHDEINKIFKEEYGDDLIENG